MTAFVRTAALALAALAVPGIAEAHTGVHALVAGGLPAGFAHPFSGLDHLLAMVAVGLWAASLGGAARWLVPASFVAVMALGAVAGTQGLALPAVETGIAASVMALGVLVALSVRIPAAAAVAVVAVFAVFHGHAHGSEMPQMAMPLAYGLGFGLATALLHGFGLAAGVALPRLGTPLVARAAGGAIALAGVALALPN